MLAIASLGCVQGEANFNRIKTVVAEKAIDGDTILLRGGERLRLIGLDAPERGEKCWAEARDRLDELTAGKRLFLERDFSERDVYGRLVRFVYADGVFVNLVLVEEGLARAFPFEPDTSMAEYFERAESDARRGKGCLWKGA